MVLKNLFAGQQRLQSFLTDFQFIFSFSGCWQWSKGSCTGRVYF